MASYRTPGPIGLAQQSPDLNDGTLVRSLTPRPGVIGIENTLASRPVRGSKAATSPAGAQVQIAEDCVIRSLQGKGKQFSVDRKTFRLVRTAEWPSFQNDERYEIVKKDEALVVLQSAALRPTISPEEKAALQEAASLLADTRVRLTGTGLLLLRRFGARITRSVSVEAPVTPSQLARMMAKDEQKEEHWIEIELLYDDGNFVDGAKYVIVTPDNKKNTGVTNAYGRARVDGIPVAGQCKISFPDIDAEAWKKA